MEAAHRIIINTMELECGVACGVELELHGVCTEGLHQGLHGICNEGCLEMASRAGVCIKGCVSSENSLQIASRVAGNLHQGLRGVCVKCCMEVAWRLHQECHGTFGSLVNV